MPKLTHVVFFSHTKAECTNERVFTGTCRVCEKEGHMAKDCPEKPPQVCRNCGEEGALTYPPDSQLNHTLTVL